MQPSDQTIIAIDGYSSCGKSTFARLIARELNYVYIDSGAMYRAVALYCLCKTEFFQGTRLTCPVYRKHYRKSISVSASAQRPVCRKPG